MHVRQEQLEQAVATAAAETDAKLVEEMQQRKEILWTRCWRQGPP